MNYVNDPMSRVRHALSGIFLRVGIREIDALVLSELIISSEPVSATRVAENLNKSLSGVTMALHRLMNLHMVKRVKTGKTYLYASDVDLLRIFNEILRDLQSHWLPALRREIDLTLEELSGKKLEMLRSIEAKAIEAENKIERILQILSETGGDKHGKDCSDRR
ncbi:MAG: hypothetical protein GXO25_05970 [Euryarchaeota archaeon]|nr:hypothetical protein [Euryarchaeota archaeon]